MSDRSLLRKDAADSRMSLEQSVPALLLKAIYRSMAFVGWCMRLSRGCNRGPIDLVKGQRRYGVALLYKAEANVQAAA